jgi:hypothetical protein
MVLGMGASARRVVEEGARSKWGRRISVRRKKKITQRRGERRDPLRFTEKKTGTFNTPTRSGRAPVTEIRTQRALRREGEETSETQR